MPAQESAPARFSTISGTPPAPVAVVVLAAVAVALAGGRLGARVEVRLRQSGPASPPWV